MDTTTHTREDLEPDDFDYWVNLRTKELIENKANPAIAKSQERLETYYKQIEDLTNDTEFNKVLAAFRNTKQWGPKFSEFNRGAMVGEAIADATKWLLAKGQAILQKAGVTIQMLLSMLQPQNAKSASGWMPLIAGLLDDVIAAQLGFGGKNGGRGNDQVIIEVDVSTLYYGQYLEYGFHTDSSFIIHPFIRPVVDLYKGEIEALGGTIII